MTNWLKNSLYPLESSLTNKDVYNSVLLSALNQISICITTVICQETLIFLNKTLKAIENSNIQCIVGKISLFTIKSIINLHAL
ncbi:MAG: hypothetical protein ACTSVV_12955 [Promethearchaeota archaeon]